MKQPEQSGEAEVVAVIAIIVLVLVLIAGGMWGCPHYNVYQQRLAGEAELRRAEQNKQIEIEVARAKMEAADLLGQAEVARARGVAEANKIIGDSLRDNEAYLRYLWINNLSEGDVPTIIYIPTEAGLPILEAGRIRD